MQSIKFKNRVSSEWVQMLERHLFTGKITFVNHLFRFILFFSSHSEIVGRCMWWEKRWVNMEIINKIAAKFFNYSSQECEDGSDERDCPYGIREQNPNGFPGDLWSFLFLLTLRRRLTATTWITHWQEENVAKNNNEAVEICDGFRRETLLAVRHSTIWI